MARAPRTAVSIWTIALVDAYTDDELYLACRVHSTLARGTLYLAAPYRA